MCKVEAVVDTRGWNAGTIAGTLSPSCQSTFHILVHSLCVEPEELLKCLLSRMTPGMALKEPVLDLLGSLILDLSWEELLILAVASHAVTTSSWIPCR